MQEYTKYVTTRPACPAGHITTSRTHFFSPKFMRQVVSLRAQRCLQLRSDALLLFSSVRGSRAAPAREHVPAPCPCARSSVPQPCRAQGNSLSARVQGRERAQPCSPQRRCPSIKVAGGGVEEVERGSAPSEHPSPTSLPAARLFATPRLFSLSLRHILCGFSLSSPFPSSTCSFPQSFDLALSPFLLRTHVSPVPPG